MPGTRDRKVLGTILASLGILVGLTYEVRADDKDALVGTPASLAVSPADATLVGRRATRQLIATGTYPEGVRDLTHALEWSSADPAVAVVSETGRVSPRGDGKAVITGRRGSVEVSTTVEVKGMGQPTPVSFRRDVMPALQPGGLQHGGLPRHADRQGGVPAQPPRLPARPGFPDPEPRGRRPADQHLRGRYEHGAPQAARRSPPRRGPAAEAEHQDLRVPPRLDRRGGPRRPRRPRAPSSSRSCPATASSTPRRGRQQLVVLLSTTPTAPNRDVTPICYYDSSSPDIAEVDADGHVVFKNRGEVAVIAHYLDLVANVRLTHLVEVPGFQVAEVPAGQPRRPRRSSPS